MVGFNKLLRRRGVAKLLTQGCYFVIEDIRQALEKDERQDVIFVFWSIDGAAYFAGSFPQPVLESGSVHR